MIFFYGFRLQIDELFKTKADNEELLKEENMELKKQIELIVKQQVHSIAHIISQIKNLNVQSAKTIFLKSLESEISKTFENVLKENNQLEIDNQHLVNKLNEFNHLKVTICGQKWFQDQTA
jgi:hypothetical protein